VGEKKGGGGGGFRILFTGAAKRGVDCNSLKKQGEKKIIFLNVKKETLELKKIRKPQKTFIQKSRRKSPAAHFFRPNEKGDHPYAFLPPTITKAKKIIRNRQNSGKHQRELESTLILPRPEKKGRLQKGAPRGRSPTLGGTTGCAFTEPEQ